YDRVIDREKEGEIIGKTEERKKISWIFLSRQILISTGVWANFFTLGLCLGSPTVIVPQLRREANSTEILSEDIVSWLSSSYNYSGTVLVVVLTILPRYMGRKKCFLLISIAAMVGFILMYLSKTMVHLLISAIINGVLMGSHNTISIIIITEYSSSQYRGLFLTIKSASFLWGVWVANIIGTFIHWKYIALVGCVLTAYILLTTLIWPESPLWLASKGRFDECAVSHHWLKGHNRLSEKELDDIVNFYKEHKPSSDDKIKIEIGKMFKGYIDMFCEKSFYKPFLLSALINLLYNSLGKMTCTVYAFDILRTIMNSESAAYTGMLILDGVTIIGAYIGSGVSKFVRRRSLMLVTTSTGILFLYLLSLYIYLVNENGKGNTTILLRQLLVCSALWSCYFLMGLCLGAPTVIIPQLRAEANSTDAISDETASWLCTFGKGRVDECTAAHRYIKGYGPESDKELEHLLNRMMIKKQVKVEKMGGGLGKFFKDITNVRFYKPLFLAIIIVALYNSLGKLTLSVYALDVIRRMTGNQKTAYWGMLTLDGVSVVGTGYHFVCPNQGPTHLFSELLKTK
ncbi:facilitated trehalose transporter Tret1-like, partial [Battus philenor]|uniref:facilitated trehalose transporter Tret1-like n=1 Tax=Battus philenor TaxID=42288 RepID=UPI0035D085AF